MSKIPSLSREIVAQDEKLRDIEQSLERKHLSRLRRGLSVDLLRALKTLSASFVIMAYPLLEEHGELLESRLSHG
jgi:phosphate:Na+ symporter